MCIQVTNREIIYMSPFMLSSLLTLIFSAFIKFWTYDAKNKVVTGKKGTFGMDQVPREVGNVEFIEAGEGCEKRVICGGDDGFAYVFNLDKGTVIAFKAHEGECMSVGSPEESEIVYTGGEDGFLREVKLPLYICIRV